MGSSSSRLNGSTPSGSGTNSFKRRALASVFCGGSASQSPIEVL
jgi:E3 ubiquitin-protein ligase RLIM